MEVESPEGVEGGSLSIILRTTDKERSERFPSLIKRIYRVTV